MKSKTAGGTVLESHPGSKIGKWFDTRTFENTDYMSWFVAQDSLIMEKMRKLNMAELRDCVEVAKKRMLRLYTLAQLDLYIRSNIDKKFTFVENEIYLQPKQIKLRDVDFDKLLKPEVKTPKKKLF